MVQHPAVADVSKALWSYASPSQAKLAPASAAHHNILSSEQAQPCHQSRAKMAELDRENHHHAQCDDKESGVQVFLDTFPQLVGTKFGNLVYRFADGIVLGLLNRRSGACDIAPPAETLVRPHRQS